MKKHLTYIFKHFDFIVCDLLGVILGYWLAIFIRRNFIHTKIWADYLFVQCGFVLVICFLITTIAFQNVSGIVKRSLPREAKATFRQVTVTYCGFTAILYLFKEAHHFSRAIYLMSFVTVMITVFIFRTILKHIIRYTNLRKSLTPQMIIVCDSDKSKAAIDRMLPGFFENNYDIEAVILSDKGSSDYEDRFYCVNGLDKLDETIKQFKYLEAYVELSDAKEEYAVINQLLDKNITVHKSLGNSKLNFLEQGINYVSAHSVITIKNTNKSLVAKIEQLERRYFKKKFEKKEK